MIDDSQWDHTFEEQPVLPCPKRALFSQERRRPGQKAREACCVSVTEALPSLALARWLSWSECRLVHQKPVGLIPSQSTDGRPPVDVCLPLSLIDKQPRGRIKKQQQLCKVKCMPRRPKFGIRAARVILPALSSESPACGTSGWQEPPMCSPP